MGIRNRIAVVVTIIAFFFFFPGIYLPMLKIASHGQFDAPIASVSVNVLDKSRSILQTVIHLFKHNNKFVAVMIFLFSVVVPVLKGILLIYGLNIKKYSRQRKIFSFIKSISKWSMCDVFIVAVFLAYFSTTSTYTSGDQSTILGFPIKSIIAMNAYLETGFFCFLAYCLLSLTALQILEDPREPSI